MLSYLIVANNVINMYFFQFLTVIYNLQDWRYFRDMHQQTDRKAGILSILEFNMLSLFSTVYECSAVDCSLFLTVGVFSLCSKPVI